MHDDVVFNRKEELVVFRFKDGYTKLDVYDSKQKCTYDQLLDYFAQDSWKSKCCYAIFDMKNHRGRHVPVFI